MIGFGRLLPFAHQSEFLRKADIVRLMGWRLPQINFFLSLSSRLLRFKCSLVLRFKCSLVFPIG
jgi:hypothetical protein